MKRPPETQTEGYLHSLGIWDTVLEALEATLPGDARLDAGDYNGTVKIVLRPLTGRPARTINVGLEVLIDHPTFILGIAADALRADSPSWKDTTGLQQDNQPRSPSA